MNYINSMTLNVLLDFASFIQIGTETNKQTPFLLCHGEEDMVVKPRYGQATAKYLNKIGFKAEFKLYPGLGHAAGLQEIEDITSYIKERLPSSQTYKSKL